MTIKKYNTFRMIIVIALAIIFSQSIIYQNYFLAIGILIISSLLVFTLRKSVKEIMADERDYEQGGKAAMLAMQIYCYAGVIAMFIFKSQASLNPSYDIIATTLAFSICIFMLLYSFIYQVKSKGKFWDKWVIYTFLVLLFFLVLGILGILKI
ncbi:MAG: DUF2178 domain-containing protein [Candidatus Paceibacterota bacterium]